MTPRNSPQHSFDWKNINLTPDQEKAQILWNTRKWLRWLRMVMIAWWTAALLGLSDPAMAQKVDEYEPLADASGTTTLVKKSAWETSDTQQIQDIVRKSWASKDFERTVTAMSEQNKQLMQQTGKNILRVQAISKPSQLVNDWNKLKESKMFKPLTEANYGQVVSELFDVSDIKDWLTNPDGSEFSDKQIANYKEQMWIDARKYWKKLDDFRTKFWEKAIKQFFDLYNLWATKMSRQSREELRRLFVAASSIVFFVNSDDNTRTRYAWLTATQLWEYTTLTAMNKDMIIAKITVWENSQDALKFLLPWEITIANFNQSTWLNMPTNLSEIALKILTESFNNKMEIIKWKKRVWEIISETELIKKDTEKTRKNIEKLDRSIYFNQEFKKLADNIEEKVKQYINTPSNKKLENEINLLIQNFRNTKKQAEVELSKDDLKWIITMSNAMETTRIQKFIILSKTKS